MSGGVMCDDPDDAFILSRGDGMALTPRGARYFEALEKVARACVTEAEKYGFRFMPMPPTRGDTYLRARLLDLREILSAGVS